MKLGAVFPQTEIGANAQDVAAFARAAEDLGYHHLVAYDHVLGAVPRDPQWVGYTHRDMFHEVFVLFGYLAAQTRQIELVNGILVLPQRQTALVAKQAAEVDVLSGGRLRLGVGVGWNDAEYEALGAEFHTRGARIEEQIHVLRLLWTQDVVTFEGRWHKIRQAGINPLPIQHPIPIWMGGESDAVLRRAARLAYGWMPGGVLRREAGRDPQALGLERRINYSDEPAQWIRIAREWQALGGTHLSVNTMRAGLATVQDHIEALRKFRETLGRLLVG